MSAAIPITSRAKLMGIAALELSYGSDNKIWCSEFVVPGTSPAMTKSERTLERFGSAGMVAFESAFKVRAIEQQFIQTADSGWETHRWPDISRVTT